MNSAGLLDVRMDGLRNSSIDRPSVFQSILHEMFSAAQPIAPLRRTEPKAVELDHHVPARVIALFADCRPSAVLARIRAVVVNAVNRVPLRWSRAHVVDERVKAIAPGIAHRDASASVVLELTARLVIAAGAHHVPDVVVRVSRQAVRAMQCLHDLVSIAATRFRRPAAKRFAVDISLRPAIASARPQRGPDVLSGGTSEHGPRMKSVACQINELWHFGHYIALNKESAHA